MKPPTPDKIATKKSWFPFDPTATDQRQATLWKRVGVIMPSTIHLEAIPWAAVKIITIMDLRNHHWMTALGRLHSQHRTHMTLSEIPTITEIKAMLSSTRTHDKHQRTLQSRIQTRSRQSWTNPRALPPSRIPASPSSPPCAGEVAVPRARPRPRNSPSAQTHSTIAARDCPIVKPSRRCRCCICCENNLDPLTVPTLSFSYPSYL